MTSRFLSAAVSLAVLGCASAACAQTGDSAANAAESPDATVGPFAVTYHGEFNNPYAIALEPGTGTIFVTEKPGALKFYKADGTVGDVSGVPETDFGGQGGFQDFAFAPDYAESGTVYLTFVEAGEDDTRGGALGKATLACAAEDACALEGFEVIWRQNSKRDGRAHFSQKIAFSPDGEYLFVSSGERAKGEPAQDLSNNLGTVVRLLPDGSPAPNNPLEDTGAISPDIWSYGHRNMTGLQFAPDGRLWDVEHGPAGGDEMNLVQPGKNYGWPVVSNGVNYDGSPIPDHDTRPEFELPAISWNPVIAPGGFTFYDGTMFPDWQGQALIVGLRTMLMVRVAIEGDKGVEKERIEFDKRLRDIAVAEDGSLWVLEDGPKARLLHLTPAG